MKTKKKQKKITIGGYDKMHAHYKQKQIRKRIHVYILLPKYNHHHHHMRKFMQNVCVFGVTTTKTTMNDNVDENNNNNVKQTNQSIKLYQGGQI